MDRLITDIPSGLCASDISAVILAGGTASRFGGKMKVKIPIGGEMMIRRIVETLRKVFEELIIVTNAREEFTAFPDCLVTSDIYKGCGPMSGIHSAMKMSSGRAIFAVAGDMPFLDDQMIRDQIAWAGNHPADAVIPVIDGRKEPLHGIYMRSIERILEKRLTENKDLSLTSLLDSIETDYFRLSGTGEMRRIFININTEKDAEKYR